MAKASKSKTAVTHRRKKNYQSFALYIYKLLKTVNKDVGISKKGMSVVNNLVTDMFEQVALESSKLVRSQKKKTLGPNDVKTAVKLLFPREFAEHSISQALAALKKSDL